MYVPILTVNDYSLNMFNRKMVLMVFDPPFSTLIAVFCHWRILRLPVYNPHPVDHLVTLECCYRGEGGKAEHSCVSICR